METLAKIRKSEFASPVEPPASIDISLRRGDSYESDERSSSSPDELAREEDELTVGLLYETRFDPREYFDQYCKSEDDPELEFWFQNLHQVFATGNDCVFQNFKKRGKEVSKTILNVLQCEVKVVYKLWTMYTGKFI
jgi:hypothetical protein